MRNLANTKAVLLVVVAVFLARGCGSETAEKCTVDSDCGDGVCLDGVCRECSLDSDCPAGHECVDNNCEESTASCQTHSCSGNGICDDTGGVITCTCDAGYIGEQCALCDNGFQDYGDGECRPIDPCADDTDCAGQHRYCENIDGVPWCGHCLPGYTEEAETCVADTTCQADTCNSHGTCDDSGGTPVCTCDPGYAGDNCENCAGGYHLEDGACVQDQACGADTCSDHGDCDDSGGSPVCTCDEGYQGDACDACADGYVFWPEDSDTCVDDPCLPDPCDVANGVAGSCVQTDVDAVLCECQAGYSWNGTACAPDSDCTDVDLDGCGDGSDCTCSDCDDGDPDIYQNAPELCDDKDNDCDGATDEDFGDLGLDCDGSDSDLCENGTWTCASDGSAVECVNESTTDIPESCNTVDDDCDGETDEDFTDLGQPCDGADSDMCENGTWTCIGDGSGTECVNESTENIVEACNGVDDDCDGETDEGFPGVGESCDGSDSDLCENGTWTCTSDGSSLECVNESSTDLLDVCDGVDNDCDPASDDGTEDPLDGAACDGADSDLCEEGTYSCVSPNLVCSDNTSSTLDICDGADNDCDPASNDGDEDPQNGAACDGNDSDLCVEGTLSCASPNLVCSDTTSSTLDICDGADNDCDPASADGSEDPLTGTACDGTDSDLCEEGTYSCVSPNLVCSDNTSSTLDVCDGADNDCDPASNDGDEDPQNGAACDGGDSDLCLEGTYSCASPNLVCSDNTGNDVEICDEVDNDCDGTTDMPFYDGTVVYDGGPFSGDFGKTKGENCGTGECSGGIVVCAANGLDLTCSSLGGISPEICDGLDNDCDGMADEGCCTGHVSDGGLEAGPSGGVWTEYSLNFVTPICDEPSCGLGTGSGPHGGTYWAWFGGVGSGTAEEASISQLVNIPAGTATLSFWLEIPACADLGTDFLEVLIDGVPVFYFENSDPNCFALGYIFHAADVSAWADGGNHDVLFYSETQGLGAAIDITNFMVDDIELEVCQ